MKKVKVKDFLMTYFVSYDFILSLAISVFLYFILPTYLKASFTSSFYNIGITVLSIIFSLFFASLAILMSSTDNDFILYLEEEKLFTGLMATFKLVLLALFVSLIYSIVIYTTNDYYIKNNGENSFQHKFCFIIFQFLFTYSLIATALSIKDTISFTAFRTRFLEQKKGKP
jgi:hypothetical protein